MAVLKIYALANGNPVSRSDFASVPLGNPYDIPVNAPLSIIGYPGVVGESVNPTRRFFQTIRKAPRVTSAMAQLETVSTIVGGNSGGTVLHKGRQVAIPTVGLREEGSSTAYPTLPFGFIHPVTWAIRPLAITSIRDRLRVPEIEAHGSGKRLQQ